MIGINHKTRTVVFDSNWYKPFDILKIEHNKKIKNVFKWFITKVLGIYKIYHLMTISEPVKVDNNYKYDIILISNTQYIFWIKCWTHKYNKP